MANNTTLNTGSGGDTIRDLDRSGVKTQIVAIDLNPSGSETLMAGAMPITDNSGSITVDGTFWQATQPISGTVTANAGTNLNTSLLALESGGNLATVATRTPALGQALAAASVPIVLTAAQLATLTPLSTLAATQSGTWTVQPGNTPNTTAWLANRSDVAVTTGSITVVDSVVSSAAGQGSQSILTGTPTANSSVTVALGAASVVSLQVTGVWTGTLAFERSVDGGTTYVPASIFLHGVSGAALPSITGNCIAVTTAGGSTHFRVRATGAVTGTASVKLQPGFGDMLIAAAIKAGTELIGTTSASNETGTVYSGTTAITPKFATFSTSSSGATTVVALVSSKRIRVLRWRVTSNGTTNVKWQSHVTPTDISGLSYCTQYKDCGGGYCPVGHFQTVSGEALDINNSAAVAISGEVTYIEV